MLDIGFLRDDASIEADREQNVAEEETLPLLYSYFYTPVRMKIDGIDLLQCNQSAHERIPGVNPPGDGVMPPGHPACPWIPLPLLDLAYTGLDAVEAVGQSGTSRYEIPETSAGLTFERQNDDVMIVSDLTHVKCQIPYATLLAAWRDFANRVRQFLLAEFPALRTHRQLGTWFRSRG